MRYKSEVNGLCEGGRAVSALRNEGIDVTPPVLTVHSGPTSTVCLLTTVHAFVIGKRAVTVGASRWESWRARVVVGFCLRHYLVKVIPNPPLVLLKKRKGVKVLVFSLFDRYILYTSWELFCKKSVNSKRSKIKGIFIYFAQPPSRLCNFQYIRKETGFLWSWVECCWPKLRFFFETLFIKRRNFENYFNNTTFENYFNNTTFSYNIL